MAATWLPVDQAAEALSVSPSTIRRRVDRGMLSKRVRNGRQEVLVPVADESAPAPQTAAQVDQINQVDQTDQDRPEDMQDPPQRPGQPSHDWTQRPPRVTVAPPRPQASSTEADEAQDDPEDNPTLTRYQRLAGASLILAQRHADEAETRALEAAAQLSTARRLNWIGGSVAAGLLIFGLYLLGSTRSAYLDARADAASTHAQLESAKRQAASAQARATAANTELNTLRTQLRTTQATLDRALSVRSASVPTD